jgi:hypothetical protein
MFGRSIVFFIAALAFVCTWSHAADVTDPESTFRITIPDDWTVERPAVPTLKVFLVSPRAAETGGNCNVVLVPDEATRGMSQNEVETMLSNEINEAWWRSAIMGARGIKSTTIEDWGSKQHRGRKAFYVRSTSVYERSGALVTLTQVLDLHVIPGRNYAVTCSARADMFAQERTGFSVIMASFEVITDMTVSAGQRGGPAPLGKPLAASRQLLMKSAIDGFAASAAMSLRAHR